MENRLLASEQNKIIKKAVVDSIEDMFPLVSKGRRVELSDIEITDNLSDTDFPVQKEIKLNRKTWQMPVHARLKLIDEESGKVISEAKKVRIASLPKVTNRYTTIIDGNEYQTINQLRRKPGIYSIMSKSGVLTGEFNLKGINFRMNLRPDNQLFVLKFANREYRLWTLLNAMGALDSEIEKIWGPKLLEINKKGALNTEVSELTSIYKVLYRKEAKDFDEAVKGIKSYFSKTNVDPEVTKITLDGEYTTVDTRTLLATSDKLLKISRGEAEPDNRDNLIFKRLYSVDDLLLEHFDKNKAVLEQKIKRNMGLRENIRDIVSSNTFTRPIKDFFTVGDMTSTPPQTNPVTIATDWRRTTPMGTGGIKSKHAITMATRDVQPTHLGFLDPLSTPESGKVGVTVGLASETGKRGNDIVTPVIDKNGKIIQKNPLQLYQHKVGFPDQMDIVDGKPKALKKTVGVMHKGEYKQVKAGEVDYYLRSPKTIFSYASNLVPFLPNVQGNRASTGSRMLTQAMSLDQKESPMVQVQRDVDGNTYEQEIGSFLNVWGRDSDGKPKKGTVEKVEDEYIHIKNDKTNEVEKVGLYKNFPLNQDGFLDTTKINVKAGDKVNSSTPLFETNYSDKNGTLAIGKNLKVAYMSYKGYNYEDGAVITESAAQKLAHTMLHRKNIFFSPKASVFDKSKFIAWYPDVLTKANMDKLDSRGLPKIGATFNSGELLAAFLIEKELDDVERALKRLDKTLYSQYAKSTTEWDEDESGVVVDVREVGRNIDIYIKATHPFKEGDKIAGRYGNKYIVTKLIPDAEAPHREDGQPIEVMLNAHGVPGRMNVGQLLETAAGKIAEKTGKTYIIDNFAHTKEKDASKRLLNEMKSHGVDPDETLTDGKDGEPYANKVFTGNQYFLKLRHLSKKKLGTHGIGQYDVDEAPTGKGAQTVGVLDTYAYLSHGAKANLREMANIKSRRNDEYWRNLQFGLPPTAPAENFAFNKMVSYLKGSGVNVEKKGNKLRIFPLTDKDVMNLSNGEITDPGAMLIGKNLASRKGGLFDEELTGGTKGTQYNHMNLANKIPNPMYEGAIQKVLGLTQKGFERVMTGTEDINGKSGTEGIIEGLKNVNVKKDLTTLRSELETAPPTNVNKLNTRIRFLEALEELNLKPEEAYTMSKLIVIPPRFRPIYPLPSGDLMTSDINKHYRAVGLINIGLKNAKKAGNLTSEDTIRHNKGLYDSVKSLQGFTDPITYSGEKYKGFIKEMSDLKRGLIHGKSWSKRQDVSGRSIITVEPTLGIDEIGIPEKMAYKMLKPFIIRDMKESGMKVSSALKEYEDEGILAKNSMREVIRQRPVILNRAPALHKHSIQAFKPVLMDGRAIKLNPLILSGFNADFDGDTMSVMTPVGIDAIEEARHMLPSKILFKHGDNQLVPSITHEYQYGLWKLSLITKKGRKSFKSIAEAKKSKIPWTEQFKLNGKPMTIGQYMINSELPKKLQDYDREMHSKIVSNLLTILGRDYRSHFKPVINSWKDLGAMYATKQANTISLTDLAIDRSYRDDLIKERMPAINNMKGEKRIAAMSKLTADIKTEQDKVVGASKNNMYDMLRSGSISGSKGGNVRQVLSLPGVLTDVKGNPINMLFDRSYGEGIDTASYFNTMFGVRKGSVDRAVNTQDSGALNKSLLNINRRLLVVEEDCATRKGLDFDIDDKDLMDRTATETIRGVVKRNDLIDGKVILNAKKAGIQVINARSPLTCESVQGICSQCYGLMPDGQLPDVGENVGVSDSLALTERATQLTMQTFHTGGAAGTGGGVIGQFPRMVQLLKVPEKLAGKATLSTVKGKVKAVEKNETGGYNIRIEGYGDKNDKDFIIPPGRNPVVKLNDKIDRGDKLSDGLVKPQELGDLKSHLEAQQYLVEEANEIYGGKFHKKTFETVIRGTSDNAQITKAPDDSGYIRGDFTSLSYVKHLNKQRKKQGLEPLEYRPYFKSIDTLNTDAEDWFTKMTTNRVKAALTTGASKAMYANIKGRDPIPAYIYGDDFGKNTDFTKGAFY